MIGVILKELKASEWSRGKFGRRWLSNPAVVVTPKPRTGEEARLSKKEKSALACKGSQFMVGVAHKLRGS